MTMARARNSRTRTFTQPNCQPARQVSRENLQARPLDLRIPSPLPETRQSNEAIPANAAARDAARHQGVFNLKNSALADALFVMVKREPTSTGGMLEVVHCVKSWLDSKV